MSNADMSNADQFDAIDTLQAALADGTLSLGQHTELQRLVCCVPEARRCYIRLVHQHATLLRLLAAESEEADTHAVRAIGTHTEDNTTPANMPVLGFLGGTVRWTREYFSQPGPLSVLVAAIFMVCLVAILEILPAPTYEPTHIGSNSTTNSPGRQPGDVAGKLKLVARITGLHNCRWSPEGRAPISYDHLGLGRELKLDSGMVEITYYNGAKVVLEGPVEFTVEKPNACRLDLGKLIANVSKRAVGFTVETPTATIVDLGTEFAVEVDKDGGDQVHVFRGEVEVGVLLADGTKKKLRLKRNMTARIDPTDGTITRMPVRLADFSQLASAAGLMAYTEQIAWYRMEGTVGNTMGSDIPNALNPGTHDSAGNANAKFISSVPDAYIYDPISGNYYSNTSAAGDITDSAGFMVPAHNDFNALAFTVEAFVRARDVPLSYYPDIVCHRADGTGWQFQCVEATETLRARFNTTTGADNQCVWGGALPQAWCHVALTYNGTASGGTAALYADYTLKATKAISGDIRSSAAAFAMTLVKRQDRQYWDLDEVRYSNGVLAPDQFLQAVSAPGPTTDKIPDNPKVELGERRKTEK